MANWLTVKCRWKTEKSTVLEDLGIDSNEDDYILKACDINLDKIVYIEDYQGYCCISFSALTDDCLITDIPYKDRDKLK